MDPTGLEHLVNRLFKSDNNLVTSDDYMNGLVVSYINCKLIPYMLDHDINPTQRYSVVESGQKTGIKNKRIYAAAKRGAIRNTDFESRNIEINGIDLAIFALKSTEKSTFKAHEVADLFGVETINFTKLGMMTSKNDSYSKHHHVFPIYDLIAAEARKAFLETEVEKKTSLPLNVKDFTVYLSPRAQRSYVRKYGLKIFDDVCLEHLQEQLADVYSDSPDIIETRDLIFHLRNAVIKNIVVRNL